MSASLWTGLALVGALAARVSGSACRAGVTGISIDTPHARAGRPFFAIKGDEHDGHDYRRAPRSKAGAAAAVVDEAHADALSADGPLLCRVR